MRTLVLFSSVFILLVAVAYYLIFSTGSKAPTQDPPKKYNVVMIVSDALRQDVLGCYGGVAETPYINWLAKNGILFENAYSTSPWTSPSAVSMFTGNYATSYEYSIEGRFKKHPIAQKSEYIFIPQIYVPHSEFLFVESLKQLDYVAGMVIENISALMHNNLQGFDSIPQFKHSKQMADSINNLTRGGLYDSWRESEAYRYSFCVLEHLLNIRPGESFFTLHWILDPHSPYDPVEKFASRIDVDESKLPVPRSYYSKTKYDRKKCSMVEQIYIRDLYFAEVESVDERVGFILQILKHKNLLDNTYIVFTSDHGEQFGEHGLFEHGGHGLNCHYYEGLIRVPLIIAGPELPKGKRIKDYVSLLGLMPTLKDLLGVKYKDNMQGDSYRPLIFENVEESEFLYFDDVQEHDQIDALVENNYKLICSKGSKFELYDIVADPQERINFATRIPQLVESMYDKILKMRNENKHRRKQNLMALGDNLDLMSDEEKREVVEKLRSLGYIK
ncbi:MAG: sulfatase-like hydrolase/transferase [Candidatus Latescibacteria bacterium]|nr:sulfatase-like hydrolase/transferase [Candidatus Latescibacterota bacterium]NIO57425.1 sulfatase-like hydrolase/transferase [Candidatus Latescibacterota bacterium]